MSALECKEVTRHCLEPCGCLPSGFSRLRYFYGKHLSVADFKDEQRYHMSKQTFHNQRLHGAGVLCGLDVSVAQDPPTEVRVKNGAALDQCGREIIVPYDQCIDVAAWYREEYEQQIETDPDCHWPDDALDDENEAMPLCILLRYSESPTGPEAAPRDPCGCGDSGCEFGRVSESFQLAIMPQSQAMALSKEGMFPSKEQITDALDNTFEGVDLLRQLAVPITAGCPAGAEETWIILGCVNAYPDPDDPGNIISVSDSDNHVPPVLLSTEVIQYLLGKIYSDADIDVGAPSIIDVQWRKVSDESYQLVLLLDKQINPVSIDPDDSFKLRKMDATGWDGPGAQAVRSKYVDVDPELGGPVIQVTIEDPEPSDYLEDGAMYHLYAGNPEGPVVDSHLRLLRPRDFIWRFRLGIIEEGLDSGDLLMETPPF